MGTHTTHTHPVLTDTRTYDRGPSGVAVAGLIIALIALVIALYAALSPRQVEQQPVTMAAPAGAHKSLSPEEVRSVAAQEMKQQLAGFEKELKDLRAQVQNGCEPAPPAGQHPAARPRGSD